MTIAVRQNTFAVVPKQNLRDGLGLLSFPLLSSGAMSEYLVASSPAALCLIDRSKRFLFVNETMAAIVAEHAASLVGCVATDLFPQADEMLARCYKLADEGKQLPNREVVWRGRHYQLCFNPLREQGSIIGLSIAAVDRSHHAAIVQRLRASRRRHQAITRQDHLTGLLNRRGLEHGVGRELRRSRRTRAPLALLMVDIDCFKGYNDGFGHSAGDKCLRTVAAAINGCLRRPADAAARYGGEEFVLLLPNTNKKGAVIVAENCRRAVELLEIEHPESPHGCVTVSIGVAAINPEAALSAVEAIDAADRALFRAKDEGRNRVSLSG